jgi:hypothetical protein
MAALKTEKISVEQVFQFELCSGWFLSIDNTVNPIQYTLTRGKKSINFNSQVISNLCKRNYGVRLVKGRKQMNLPPHVLQAFIDNEAFLYWFDPSIQSEGFTQSHDVSHDTYMII